MYLAVTSQHRWPQRTNLLHALIRFAQDLTMDSVDSYNRCKRRDHPVKSQPISHACAYSVQLLLLHLTEVYPGTVGFMWKL